MTQYSEKSYKMASDNTKYNDDGKAVISENDEWRDEKEWDEVFERCRRNGKTFSSNHFPFTETVSSFV